MPYTNSPAALKKSAITLGLGILIVMVIYLFFDIKARLEFQQVHNEVERIGTEVIEPMGGVKAEYEEVYDVTRGENLLARWSCISTTCPNFSEQWFIPLSVSSSDETVFDNIKKESGYSYNTNEKLWEKGGLKLGIAETSFPHDVGPPEKALPGDQEWRRIVVHVYRGQ